MYNKSVAEHSQKVKTAVSEHCDKIRAESGNPRIDSALSLKFGP